MKGKIFITRQGYDPQLGKYVKDPYLGDTPSIGACRPDFRRQLSEGDHIFVISGKVPKANQFVMGGFEIAEKIDVLEAYRRFPEQRLSLREDGQLQGNVVIDEGGVKHHLDTHKPKTFGRRIENYVVGCDPIMLRTDAEIGRGRDETVYALREILGREGNSPIELVTRFGRTVDEVQISKLRSWLSDLKGSR